MGLIKIECCFAHIPERLPAMQDSEDPRAGCHSSPGLTLYGSVSRRLLLHTMSLPSWGEIPTCLFCHSSAQRAPPSREASRSPRTQSLADLSPLHTPDPVTVSYGLKTWGACLGPRQPSLDHSRLWVGQGKMHCSYQEKGVSTLGKEDTQIPPLSLHHLQLPFPHL